MIIVKEKNHRPTTTEMNMMIRTTMMKMATLVIGLMTIEMVMMVVAFLNCCGFAIHQR